MPGITIKPLGAIAAGLARLQNSLYQPPSTRIEGVEAYHWPSALQPIAPLGPAGSSPLQIPFWMGQNLNYTPRPDAEYGALALKVMARYPLARFCIENTKDILCATPWSIQLRPKPGESKKERAARAKGNQDLVTLSNFFEYPDGENCWEDWLRPILDDMLVIDAGGVLLLRSKANKVMGLRWMPGEGITRYVDDNGITPAAPSPAYAQLWEGIPRVNLTTDQLVYRPRNIAPCGTISSYLYGYSPTEQAAKEIMIGMARLEFVLKYYTDGSIPDALQIIPAGVSPDSIDETYKAINSELAGQLAKRRGWYMMQGFTQDGKDQIIFPKEKLLSDPYDDLHIHKICFAYGTSPQRLLKMLNRASAEANQEAAEEEGTRPFRRWVINLVNFIIQRKMGYSEIEMVMNPENESDIAAESAADTKYIEDGVYTINERRELRGDDPRAEPEADQLMVKTPQGMIPLAEAVKAGVLAAAQAQAKEQQSLLPTAASGQPQPGAPTPKPKPGSNGKVLRVDRGAEPVLIEGEPQKKSTFYSVN